MNLDLLKYMDRRVRVIGDITHQEYRVAGANWDTEEILVLFDIGARWTDRSKLELVPEEDED